MCELEPYYFFFFFFGLSPSAFLSFPIIQLTLWFKEKGFSSCVKDMTEVKLREEELTTLLFLVMNLLSWMVLIYMILLKPWPNWETNSALAELAVTC